LFADAATSCTSGVSDLTEEAASATAAGLSSFGSSVVRETSSSDLTVSANSSINLRAIDSASLRGLIGSGLTVSDVAMLSSSWLSNS
jgi:hypothetical protein